MKFFKSPTNIYLFIISFVGSFAFLFFLDLEPYSMNQWVITFALVGAALLVNHFAIELPPQGNRLSMDSAVFLASLFLFGLEFSLNVLFIFALIFTFTQREIAWWKHLFNFALYCLMLVTAYFSFTLTGGTIGNANLTNLSPYLISLTIYFVTNVTLIGGFFYIATSENMITVLKGMMKDTLATYSSTLLLSLVLVILMDAQNIFGLFLFLCIAFLLSQAFRRHFELYMEVSEKANKDYLTGLNNHGYFKELFEKEFSHARETDQPLSVAILDIDDFKKYNDLYGHIQGDQLLKEFGSLLKTETEAKNFIVARYGGEEFSIIMPNTHQENALTFINYLRKKTNDSHYEGVDLLPYGCLSFSAGIAELKKATYSTSELLNKADVALYSVKDQGKNMVRVYNEHSDYLAQHSLNFEKELSEAEQQLRIFLSKDVYTYRHSKRVYQYAVDFSKKLNLSKSERKTLILGALVHDIGKIEIPRDIINKKGKLEPHEWEIMKKHVTWGKEIISANKKLEDLIPVIELHHERYDGNGYLHGLKGENIPKLARILCIIDSFDAMTTERPYQKTKTFAEAIVELRTCAGKQFDPVYVEPFIEMIVNNNYRLDGSHSYDFNHENAMKKSIRF